MYVRLSYTLTKDTPTYRHNGEFSSVADLQVTKGDVANTRKFTMMNHVGTHLDAPHHFLNNGKTVDSFDISAFVFERPALLGIKKGDGELITRKDIEDRKEDIAGRDLLLIRTGFSDLRSTDTERYEFSGPGFSSEAADYLLTFRELRAVGFDFVSLNSPKYEEEGWKAHRTLLSKDVRNGFFIIEDMNLKKGLTTPRRVFVAPLYAEGFDGGPCTVIAEI